MRVARQVGEQPEFELLHAQVTRDTQERDRYGYFNLDSDVLRAAAEADPVRFVADLPARAIVDELQRVPSLFTALEVAVDRDRAPGKFLLTGSANVRRAPAGVSRRGAARCA